MFDKKIIGNLFGILIGAVFIWAWVASTFALFNGSVQPDLCFRNLTFLVVSGSGLFTAICGALLINYSAKNILLELKT